LLDEAQSRDRSRVQQASAQDFRGGARAAEVRYALYVEDWRQKIERIGNLNYPESARGRIYGQPQAHRVDQLGRHAGGDGSRAILRIQILDAAAQRIVQTGGALRQIPADIPRKPTILVITRTWQFCAR